MGKDDKIAAHGKTRGFYKTLLNQQAGGNPPKMVKANGKDAPAGYQVPEAEKGFVHFEIEDRLFNQTTGEKLSTPAVQIMSPKEFKAAEENKAFAGKTMKIFHAPKEAKEELGSALEGARSIDSNFAAMQQQYEALTGELPPADWTPAMLDVAIKAAEKVAGKTQTQPLAPISEEENKTNTAPVIAGTPAALAANTDAAKTPAEAAKEAAENTAPTQDGRTSVGQKTEETDNKGGNPTGGDVNSGNPDNATADKKPDADKKEDAAKKDEAADKVPAAAAGRRGESPVAKKPA